MEDVHEKPNKESVNELTESQKKDLQELKKLIQDGLENDQLTFIDGDLSTIWGVLLVGDDRTDMIILKFLKASSFNVLDAYAMIKNTLLWRNEVGIRSLLEEDLEFNHDYNNVMVTHGYDKQGYPVWYLVLEDVLGDNLSYNEQKQRKLLRWLIQFTEKNIRKLIFSTRKVYSISLVIDLKSLTRYGNGDLYRVVYKFLQLLHDHYPEFVAKQVFNKLYI